MNRKSGMVAVLLINNTAKPGETMQPSACDKI